MLITSHKESTLVRRDGVSLYSVALSIVKWALMKGKGQSAGSEPVRTKVPAVGVED